MPDVLLSLCLRRILTYAACFVLGAGNYTNSFASDQKPANDYLIQTIHSNHFQYIRDIIIKSGNLTEKSQIERKAVWKETKAYNPDSGLLR